MTGRDQPFPNPAEWEQLARALTRLGLASPAIFLLESTRPLHYSAAQLAQLASPLVAGLSSLPGSEQMKLGAYWEQFRRCLEEPAAVDALLKLLEDGDRSAGP